MSDLQIDTAFPGGNGIIERIDGDDVWLHQDQRDTCEWWFWWNIRLRNAGGRTLRFHFTAKDVLTTRGPAVSLDGGAAWSWGDRLERLAPSGFSIPIPAGAVDVRLAMAIPYTSADLDRFLVRQPTIVRTQFCLSRTGRAVPLLRAGRLDGKAAHRVLLTARHHACESIASFTLEGLLAAAGADDALGHRLRDRVEFLCVPIVDFDGVENGDQGKSRTPHDHNRDYVGDPLYSEIRAIREHALVWADGRLHLTLDLHCPWIRGSWHEHIYAVEQEERTSATRLARFAAVLEAERRGTLPYEATGTIAHGVSWNTATGAPTSCSRWLSTLPGVVLGTSFEIPYANVRQPGQALAAQPDSGIAVTPDNARAFGRDLAAAIDRWLASDADVRSAL